jgi:hypothetical protein
MFKLIRPDVLNRTRACFAANVQTFFHSFHFPAIFLHFFHSNACQIKFLLYLCTCKHHNGVLAHLARARHWQCRGERFESAMLHKKTSLIIAIQGRFFIFTDSPDRTYKKAVHSKATAARQNISREEPPSATAGSGRSPAVLELPPK